MMTVFSSSDFIRDRIPQFRRGNDESTVPYETVFALRTFSNICLEDRKDRVWSYLSSR